eukprot:jgi/Ulvmu1/2337/UM013_0185.1
MRWLGASAAVTAPVVVLCVALQLLGCALAQARPSVARRLEESNGLLSHARYLRWQRLQATWSASSHTDAASRLASHELLQTLSTDFQMPMRKLRETPAASGEGPAESAAACSGLLEAVAQRSASFSASLRASEGIVSASTEAVLTRPGAQFTVLVPPPSLADTLLAAFRDGDVDMDTARSTVLLHVLPQRVSVAGLRRLGGGAAVATLSAGANLTVRLAGPEAVELSHGSVRALITDAAIPACGTQSMLHSVDMMLLPQGFALPPPDAYPTLSEGGVGGSGKGLAGGVIAGIVLACVAVVLAMLAGVVFLRKRHASCVLRAEKTKDPVPRITTNCDRPTLLPYGLHGPPQSDRAGRDGSPTVTHSWNPVATLSEFADDDGDDEDGDGIAATVLRVPRALVTAGGSSPAGAAAVSLFAATGDPSSSSHAAPHTAGTTPGSSARHANAAADLAPPLPGARAEERRQWLSHQLDCIGTTPLLQRFVLLGPTERRHSENSVVQYARSTEDDEDYAFKFFISREKFEAERTVFAHWILGAMLPRLEGLYDNRDAALQDPRGHALPPCVIMERGESLAEWFQRRKPDLRTALPVVANIAKRVAGMHRGGYVHRDLKPGNIMWLPRDSQWSLIDFGVAAEIGRPAPLNCTPPYAPPEVVAAWNGGRMSVTATHALDAWALGVVVFEMLTGRPPLDTALGSIDAVREALLGEAPLPWERLSPEDRRRLGPCKGPVLLLLQRDPLMRPSLDLFYHKCNALIT